jgi:glycosyltransferase involved in cell wall biosynthesis
MSPCPTVVLCTRNRPALLARCLDAVLQLKFPRFDVLVVDNASDDGSTAAVAAQKGVRCISEPRVGLNRARNTGARACESEVVAYLDDDAVPHPSWLSAILEPFEDAQVMAVAGRILPPSVETEAEKYCADYWRHDLGLQPRSVDPQVPNWFELTNFGGVGIGANMAFRRAAFSEGGVFNERLDRGTPLFGFGEHYAFFSLVHRGHRVIYAPEATALHPYPASMELLRDRHLNDLTSSAGYLLFLLLEHPHYRIATLRFIARGLRKGPLDWKRIHRPPRPRLVPRWQASMALVKGLLRYLQSLAVPSRKSGRPAPFPAQSSTECLLVPPKQ